MTRVSILIPCYNAAERIGRAIESAMAQTIEDKEVIVVDDGSTDESLAVIRSFEENVKHETGSNRGGNAARNRLLEFSNGEWIQYLDADDYLHPEKIEQQLAEAAASQHADVLYSPVIFEETSASGNVSSRELTLPAEHDPWKLLVSWDLPQTGGCLWRREALIDLGGWNESQSVCQEHELYLRALSAGKQFVRSPTAGAVYCHWSEETVCRKNPLNTFRAKMEIVSRAAELLDSQGELDTGRRVWIADRYLECARSCYSLDRAFAEELALRAKRLAPGHIPNRSGAFPLSWRLAYRTAGFQFAETLAALTRRMRQGA